MKETTYYALNDQGINKDKILIITDIQPYNDKRVFNFFGNTTVSNLNTPLLDQDNHDHKKKPR